MCVRFARNLRLDYIARLFGVSGEVGKIAPNLNIGPRHASAVVCRHPETGKRRLEVRRWGLVPHFAQNLRDAPRPINVRAEMVAISDTFCTALEARRCLVPADAFYEWKVTPDGEQPYAIARADGAPLAFAGLWDDWISSDGKTLRSFTIITTTSNLDLARLHNRMPVILERDAWPVWLGEEPGQPTELLLPAAEGLLQGWPVDSRAIAAP